MEKQKYFQRIQFMKEKTRKNLVLKKNKRKKFVK